MWVVEKHRIMAEVIGIRGTILRDNEKRSATLNSMIAFLTSEES